MKKSKEFDIESTDIATVSSQGHGTWKVLATMTGIVIVLMFTVLYFFGEILLPFITGALVAYLLRPIVNKMDSFFPYSLINSLLAISFFFSLLILIFLNIIPAFVSELSAFINNFSQYLTEVILWLELPVDVKTVESLSQNSLWQLMNTDFLVNIMFNAQSWGWLLNSGYQMIYVIYFILITPMVTFYLLKDWAALMASVGKCIDVFVADPYKKHVYQVLSSINDSMSSFAHGQFLVSALLAIYYVFALSFLGLASAVFIGLLSSIMIFVPYVGAIFSVFLASIVAIGQFSPDFVPLILVLAIYVIGQILEDVILFPILLGKRMQLHPLLVVVSVFIFARMFGVVGILISIPLVAVIRSFMTYIMCTYASSTKRHQ